MRAANQEGNSLVLRAERLIPCPSCAGFLKAKGTDACRESAKNLASPLGGTLETVPVLRGLLKSKGRGRVPCRLLKTIQPSTTCPSASLLATTPPSVRAPSH